MKKEMTVKDLYDYILSEMTAEEALMKLLKGHLVEYKKLKFSKGEAIHPVLLVATVAMEMGWLIAIDEGEEDVRGLTIGTDDYMKNISIKKKKA